MDFLRNLFNRKRSAEIKDVSTHPLSTSTPSKHRNNIQQNVKDLAHADSQVKFRARAALAEIGTPALPYLVMALRSDVFDVSYGASEALKKIALPETTAALIGILSESDTTASARERAIEILGFVGDPQTTQVLLPLLSDPLFEIRRAAATALSRLGWKPSSPRDMALLELCIDGSNLVTTAEINGFNGRIQTLSASAIEPLSNAIKTCRDWRIARSATGALACIGGDQVLPALYEVVRTFHKLHQHDTGDVRKTAALAIGRIKTGGRMSSAIQLAQAPASDLPPQAPLIKVEALEALGQGNMIRVWHHELDCWATNWLEVVDVVDDFIILRDAVTGEEEVRYISDSIPSWKWPVEPA
jgi:HEAT repeat protein